MRAHLLSDRTKMPESCHGDMRRVSDWNGSVYIGWAEWRDCFHLLPARLELLSWCVLHKSNRP
jgi:hypothetical protein